MKRAVYYIGDSTVQTNFIDTWPQCGMGQELYLYLKPDIEVHNHAKNGRSTKSFWDEGLFEPVLAGLKAGDVLLIQFGHNDEKPLPIHQDTTPGTLGYRARLLRYARLAREKGALPVLITPLTRRHFCEGQLTDTHGEYPQVVRELAAAEGLPLIDLTASSRELVEQLGEAASCELYMNFGAQLYPNYPGGSADNTHLRYCGAVRFAGLVAQGLKALGGDYASLLL